MDTQEAIRMLREFLAEATPGPWSVDSFHGDDEDTPRSAMVKMFDAGDPGVLYSLASEDDPTLAPAVTGNGPRSRANAFLIAAAVTNLPALLDELERLERERDRLATIVRVQSLPVPGAAGDRGGGE